MKRRKSLVLSVDVALSQKTELKLDWCSHEAAKWACEHWHYSKSIPVGKTVKIGVWEDSVYRGVVIFSRGANNNIAAPYGLTQTECVELTRIALWKHQTPVSRILTIALRFLERNNPGLRLIVSYADPEQNHHGGIYQATNWYYIGLSGCSESVLFRGRWQHKRTVDSIRGNHKGLLFRETTGKHKYLMPLDEEMRKQIEPLRQPYPKRASIVEAEHPAFQPEDGGIKSDLDAPELQ
jgi:hypothetical protein